MLHLVKLISRRYPNNSKEVINALVVLSALVLVVGIILALRQ